MITTDEWAELGITRGSEVLIVRKGDCSRPLQRLIEIGGHVPMYATAVGKAILAHLPDNKMDQHLSPAELTPITQSTITVPEILRQDLKAICSGGLAYSREELNEGMIAMAAPVFDLYGAGVAPMVVPVPTVRFTVEKKSDIEQALYAQSAALSHKLGFDSHSNPSNPSKQA